MFQTKRFRHIPVQLTLSEFNEFIFLCAAATLCGVELCHMIRKGQNLLKGTLSVWEQFYALAG